MRESRTLEYKENLSSNTFLKTISAYANYGEGKIIFGINDQGNVIGITDPVNGCLNLENKINDSLSPVPEFRLEIQENTIVLTVYEGRYKPYLYKGKAYKRNDSSTVEVDRLEYNRLILEGCNQTFEEILPIYCKVLLQKDYKKYLAEIIIDGYTDTDGDYDYNLELSQKRSLAVAQYLTEIRENFLSSDEISELQNYLTVNGHGSANPVLDSDGNVDKDASRRVEVKFRLKDDEMINELNQIMNTDKTSDSEKSGSN